MATSRPGVVRVKLEVADLAATRFAFSPLFETFAALRVLADPGRHRLHLPWIRWAQRRVASAPLRLPTMWPLMIEPAVQPEILLPAPATRRGAIDEEIKLLLATTDQQVRTSVGRYVAAHGPSDATSELAAQPRHILRAVASELREAYGLLIAPHWHRMQGVLDDDIIWRSRDLASGGAARMFSSLHQWLTWTGDCLEVRDPAYPAGSDRCARVMPGGLVLVPSVFLWPELWVKRHTITHITIRYPARGVRTLWETAANVRRAGRPACERLIGRARAQLLALLASPATTSELAMILHVTPSAVSQHLNVLRLASLIRSDRNGRAVLHVITPLGRLLLDGRAE